LSAADVVCYMQSSRKLVQKHHRYNINNILCTFRDCESWRVCRSLTNIIHCTHYNHDTK